MAESSSQDQTACANCDLVVSISRLFSVIFYTDVANDCWVVPFLTAVIMIMVLLFHSVVAISVTITVSLLSLFLFCCYCPHPPITVVLLTFLSFLLLLLLLSLFASRHSLFHQLSIVVVVKSILEGVGEMCLWTFTVCSFCCCCLFPFELLLSAVPRAEEMACFTATLAGSRCVHSAVRRRTAPVCFPITTSS